MLVPEQTSTQSPTPRIEAKVREMAGASVANSMAARHARAQNRRDREITGKSTTVSNAPCLFYIFDMSCFMGAAPSALTGALISWVNVFLSAPSNVSVSGTLSPALTSPFRPIIMM